MSQMFKILVPEIEKVKIDRVDGIIPGLPKHLVSLTQSYDYVWKVTVTPIIERVPPTGKNTNLINLLCGPCTAVVSADYGKRTGNLFLDNQGRVGEKPSPEQDDLRPAVYYVWGKGTQTFEVIFNKFSMIRNQKREIFD